MGIFGIIARAVKTLLSRETKQTFSKSVFPEKEALKQTTKTRKQYINKAQKAMEKTNRVTYSGEGIKPRTKKEKSFSEKFFNEVKKETKREVTKPIRRYTRLFRRFNNLLANDDKAKMSPEKQAQFIINKTNVGSRIIGSTVEIWKEPATEYNEYGYGKVNQDKIIPALFEYFNVNSYQELLEIFEKNIGDKIYQSSDTSTGDFSASDPVRLLIQSKMADGSFVY